MICSSCAQCFRLSFHCSRLNAMMHLVLCFQLSSNKDESKHCALCEEISWDATLNTEIIFDTILRTFSYGVKRFVHQNLGDSSCLGPSLWRFLVLSSLLEIMKLVLFQDDQFFKVFACIYLDRSHALYLSLPLGSIASKFRGAKKVYPTVFPRFSGADGSICNTRRCRHIASQWPKVRSGKNCPNFRGTFSGSTASFFLNLPSNSSYLLRLREASFPAWC